MSRSSRSGRWLPLALVAAASVVSACAGSQTTAGEVVTVTEEAIAETVTVTETVSGTEAELAELEAERQALDDRKVRLDDRAARLDQRKRELDRRERRIAREERSQFGDGSYLVGTDVPAGSYVAAGGDACYWERSTPGATGLDAIIDNYLGAGQARATLYAGELFTTQGCGTWRPG